MSGESRELRDTVHELRAVLLRVASVLEDIRDEKRDWPCGSYPCRTFYTDGNERLRCVICNNSKMRD